MTEKTVSRPFHWRGLTSFTLTLAFLAMAITGIALSASPQGRVANWTGWRILALTKEQWGALHTTFSTMFLLAGGFHIYFNWKPLMHYLAIQRKLNLKFELMSSLAIAAVVLAGTLWQIPPFQTLVDAGDRIKAYWEEHSLPAPYPHAEESTLREFAARTGIPLEELTEQLKACGIAAENVDQTIDQIAKNSQKTPSQLFAVLQKSRLSIPVSSSHRGRGLGKMTLASACEENSLSLEAVQTALSEKGISCRPSDTLSRIAYQLNTTPAELLDWLAELSRQSEGSTLDKKRMEP